ncbi:factor-independent urate hydroxylase [Actinocatenispora rupis]|uniref:Uricase n=1 Tax=Actinocatenispora rupis TaxID=519421 RepID=A0A8J3N966_9ACTN|nr:urate oxidase [Actinocatenispora rupis]GID11029.1 uricase [Actinocatenispora rupis]
MAIVLGDNRYGKAGVRLVRVDRGEAWHRITDLTVDVALSGELTAVHLSGDNAHVLPTDTQKNTVYAFAADGVGEVEEFGLRLARHFVATQPAIGRAVVTLAEYEWDRIEGADGPAPHSFSRSGRYTRTARVVHDAAAGTEVVSGLRGLTVLNTTDSEFVGYAVDRYTTLPETKDRILATDIDARWRHRGTDGDWAASFAAVRRALLAAFAGTYSRSLQQTLYAMGRQVLAERDELVEVRLSLPNRHHYLVDLAPFGRDNPNAVFLAGDRPYGLVEGTVRRDDAPAALVEL